MYNVYLDLVLCAGTWKEYCSRKTGYTIIQNNILNEENLSSVLFVQFLDNQDVIFEVKTQR